MTDSGRSFDNFYEPGVLVPDDTHANCTDDVAMVEFGGLIRFFYIFRLKYFDSISDVLTYLNLNPEHIDAVVYDRSGGRPDEIKKVARAAHYIDFGSVISTLADHQRRDTGFFYSERDPFGHASSNLKVGHSCMPGLADDEHHLMLFLLRYQLEIASDEPHYYAPLA